MVSVAGVALSDTEPAAGFTVRPSVNDALTLPLVPVTVRLAAPSAVDEVVVTVSVEVALPPEPSVTDAGLKPAVAPLGSPDTVRATAPLKEFTDDTVTV